jgi:hypothetical protein
MEVNVAVAVINSSDRTSAEKKHLRTLVRSGRILPASFAGSPDFDEILGDFPAYCRSDVCMFRCSSYFNSNTREPWTSFIWQQISSHR